MTSITKRNYVSMLWFFIGLSACLFLGWVSTQAQEVLVDLNREGDWIPIHDLSPIGAEGDGLFVQAIEADPYMVSRPLSFAAERYKAIVIEMSVSQGSMAQVFWSQHPDGHFTEPASDRVMLKGDGQFHTYTLSLFNHPKWSGEIKRLRLDPVDRTAEIRLRSFKIVNRLGPKIEVVNAHPSVPFVVKGEKYEMRAGFRNAGDSAGLVTIKTSTDGILDTTQVYINANEEKAISYMREETSSQADISWESYIEKGNDNSLARGKIRQEVKFASLQTPSAEYQSKTSNWRIISYKEEGLCLNRLQVKKDGIYEDIGWIKDAGIFSIQYENGGIYDTPFAHSLVPQEQGSIEPDTIGFVARSIGGFEYTVKIEAEEIIHPRSALRLRYILTNPRNQDLTLLRFTGPMLYVGEKSFGSKKDRALFPGLEYLDAEAVSSSDAVARPPVRDQYIPHPWKVTVPAMAVVNEGKMISLLWPANQEWAPGQRGMSPVFASPNRFYGQNNSLMGLFVPPVPDYGLENQETASKPYLVKPGEEVKFECILYMAQTDDPIDAVLAWLDFYNEGKLPEPATPPRNYLDEIALSRQAFLTTCWDEQAKGWGHCAGWKAHPSGGMLALLALDEMLTSDPEAKKILRERINLVYRELVDKHGPASLGVAAGCHVMMFESAFFWGVTEQTMPSWLKVAEGLISAQNPDGSWGFRIGKEEQRDLGKEGEVVSGTIAPDAMYLMQLARITGNAKITQAGLKSLEALNQHRVPRGSQGWECPIAAPDVLVSGYGTRANLDAYLITGEKRYLEHAVYWAKTGLAFHYLWNLPDRPLQRYATIPIFGTTFFTHSWLGVPVQWCGLVYTYHLLELAEHDNTLPWRTLAEGIVNSAMHQQMTDGPYIGTLPDSYGDYFITARGAYINPENILSNLHVLNGNSLDIRTAFINGPGTEALRVSANAVLHVSQPGNDKFIYELSLREGRVSESVIAPLNTPPTKVTINGNPVTAQETIFENTEGWRYNPEMKTLFIHAKHEKKKIEIEVRLGNE